LQEDLLKAKNAALIRDEAYRLGFSFCGFSEAGFLEEEAPRLERWLNNNQNGKMDYMSNHFDKRLDPRLLHEGTKSVVSLLFNYYPEQTLSENNNYKISKYAYGKDYHSVVKEKLKELLSHIQEEIGEVSGRVFVDSAPVLEKAWAAKSGLGWFAKNANLINKKHGSFYFIAELLLDIPLPQDSPATDHCGSCTKCIDACPTDAILEPYVVDGSKCISYFTIELKEAIPDEMRGKFDDWIFGCDVCQDVCPWNKFSQENNESLFNPHPLLSDFKKGDWEEITQDVFNEVFRNSAVKRTKYSGLVRNIQFVKNYS
jgi:epoxyqueuosine reductase